LKNRALEIQQRKARSETMQNLIIFWTVGALKSKGRKPGKQKAEVEAKAAPCSDGSSPAFINKQLWDRITTFYG
jgi:hypothetical protein